MRAHLADCSCDCAAMHFAASPPQGMIASTDQGEIISDLQAFSPKAIVHSFGTSVLASHEFLPSK